MNIPKDITQCNIEEHIVGLKQLLVEYNHHRHDIGKCVLCDVARPLAMDIFGDYTTRKQVCGYCPWYWFTGVSCIDYYEDKGKDVRQLSQVDNGDSTIIRNRKEQIKRWIIKLEDYIESI